MQKQNHIITKIYTQTLFLFAFERRRIPFLLMYKQGLCNCCTGKLLHSCNTECRNIIILVSKNHGYCVWPNQTQMKLYEITFPPQELISSFWKHSNMMFQENHFFFSFFLSSYHCYDIGHKIELFTAGIFILTSLNFFKNLVSNHERISWTLTQQILEPSELPRKA